ncbi:tyrosine-type recombinase/integrase [Pontibacter sp. E15-1]|uniref:tyrosine-type recombinase/integrase n=1 Tax=Pontibacter sp. E15-1 TaxID=2919918 RepID=UPI001F4F88C7|nr:tyrosine-type recombinase/integrase [Pontibacter sp. E15-1]MCJ8165101.1 tyrosine-type recombinase/integrase [Pontibacter sp. E15-1]
MPRGSSKQRGAAREPDLLPTVLSKQEVKRILEATDNLKHRCMLQLLYAGGLRIGEVINLRITDVRSDRNLLYLCGDKGKKNCTTLLSQKLLENLRITSNISPKCGCLRGRRAGSTQ